MNKLPNVGSRTESIERQSQPVYIIFMIKKGTTEGKIKSNFLRILGVIFREGLMAFCKYYL